MDLSASTVIARPSDEVFAYVMDLSHDANWRTGVDMSAMRDDAPLGPGAVGYTRAGKGEVQWRILAYEPGVRVEWELLGEGPFRGTGGYLLESLDAGKTRFTLLASIEPGGIYRLLGPIFGRAGRSRNQADVDRLRDLLEQS